MIIGIWNCNIFKLINKLFGNNENRQLPELTHLQEDTELHIQIFRHAR